jgi:hypothetical protein
MEATEDFGPNSCTASRSQYKPFRMNDFVLTGVDFRVAYNPQILWVYAKGGRGYFSTTYVLSYPVTLKFNTP